MPEPRRKSKTVHVIKLFFLGTLLSNAAAWTGKRMYVYIYMYMLFVRGMCVYYVISNRNMYIYVYRGRGVDRIKARTVGPLRRAPEPASAHNPVLCS